MWLTAVMPVLRQAKAGAGAGAGRPASRRKEVTGAVDRALPRESRARLHHPIFCLWQCSTTGVADSNLLVPLISFSSSHTWNWKPLVLAAASFAPSTALDEPHST
jgi:hypothetical protein